MSREARIHLFVGRCGRRRCRRGRDRLSTPPCRSLAGGRSQLSSSSRPSSKASTLSSPRRRRAPPRSSCTWPPPSCSGAGGARWSPAYRPSLARLARGNPAIKIIFNVSQRILAVVAGCRSSITALGGQLPPAYLSCRRTLASQMQFSETLGSSSSSRPSTSSSTRPRSTALVVLSSGRAFREVWNLNTRGVLGYDLGASAIAVLVAWLYTRFDHWLGFGSLGLDRCHRSDRRRSACVWAVSSTRGQRAGASASDGQGHRSSRSIYLGPFRSR